ncbi:hypothetical protein OG874_19490 [Nocardia sp. NBC_00565]|uniref:hypothetical protein n=1 Tax=Nocardia sp. NBC_00565 TaxID=2975993 RepID=UPI002E7FFEA8|nr:hypothetical protein [Nocardia sp. NBC_00565]WUC07142.1 hypothetical protein OG874_19490 [Nocardia sp. NBC_00565]
MAAQNKRPRRGSAADDMVKLHRRTMVLDGRVYTVLSLRPGNDVRFATNRFHDTWHVLSDWRGARVLARLLWGLAYQRRPGTLVVIDPVHLDPNPFDAAPSDPIVLVPSELTVFTRAAAAALRRRLPLRDRSQGTVRWQTFGLDAAVARLREWRAQGPGERSWHFVDVPTGWERVDRIGGLVTIFGAPDQLRSWGTSLATLGTYACYGMDYEFLDEERNGEVQIFRQYRRKVSIARQARAEVLARCDGHGPAEEVQRAIWSHGATVRRRRLPALEASEPLAPN